MDFIHFFGRFHTLALHLPIGLLAFAFILELVSRKDKFASLKPAVKFTLFWGMISALISAFLGYLLHLEGGYDMDLLVWHARFGYGVAALSVALYFIKTRMDKTPDHRLAKLYMPVFILTMLSLAAAGHKGGSLTHGSNYLTEHTPQPFRGWFGMPPKLNDDGMIVSNMDSAVVFTALIHPILKKRCEGCHNPGKIKGELLMNTIEGMQKGGESGALFVAGSADQSRMIQRVELEASHEDHMPPEGKKQLNNEEISLLRWWIDQGASFDKQVAFLEQTEEIKSILDKRIEKRSGLYAMNIDPLSDGQLSKLQNKGINIQRQSASNSFLEVRLSDHKILTKALLDNLKSAADQIVSLDLGNTNVTDEMLTIIKRLPHLTWVYLDQTAITDETLKHLENCQFLEYLNVYQTKVTDAGLDHLKNLKYLKSLYLWQTEVSESGVATFVKNNPALHVNNGIENDSLFASVKLKPPNIIADHVWFTDTVEADLKINFANVKIHYTLDGTDPTPESPLYEKPLKIFASTKLRAASFLEEWETSAIVEKQFVQMKYQPRAIKLNKKPSDKYPAKGKQSLIDFKKGGTEFNDGLWMGFEKGHLEATLDLGKVEDVSAVTVSCLENTGAWIFYPKAMDVWTSVDGQNFKKIAAGQYPIAAGPEPPSLNNFTENFEPTKARYIKVKVLSNLKNPDWHPGAGQPCWIFVDEILVQ